MACLISVIIPTYNHENYIRLALNSVLMQKCSYPLEILVGDDASTDQTPEILKEYQTLYPHMIHLFLHKKNIGATKNAYQLLTSAHGVYLATLEGDDYWTDENKLQVQVDFLESHPEFVGCTHRFKIVDEGGNLLKKQRLSWVRQKECFSLKDFDGIRMPGQPSTFVRRNIFLNSKLDYSICYKVHSMIADRTLMLIFLSKGNFYCVDCVMSHYRRAIHPQAQNITNQIYNKKDRLVRNDVDFLLTLEQYARTILKVPVEFESRKRLFLLDALFALACSPSRANLKEFVYILKSIQHPMGALLLLPFTFLKKVQIFICYHI